MPEMMNITVRNKIATKTDNVAYVCGNSDYVINFDFDSEWDAYDTKTARFAHDGQHTDVVFSGNQCNVPIITNTYAFHVGVFAGDLHTTTAARVPCRKSILCGSGAPADPTPDVYDQLMEIIKGLGGVDPDDIVKAVADYLAAHPIEETDPTVPEWAKAETKPTYSAAEVGAIAQSDLQAATDAALAQAKASGEFDGATGPAGPQGPAGVPGKDGAGMDVTGATVGQIAKIAAVDASGVPTAWGPANMAGETWGLLAEQTLTEAVKAVSMKLAEPTKHFIMQVWCPKIDASVQPMYFNLGVNGSVNNIWYYLSAKLPYIGNTSQLSIEAKSIADNTWAISAYSNVGGGYGTATNYNSNVHVPVAIKSNDANIAETVRIEVVANDQTQYFPTGTVVRVWGVRA